MKALRDRQGLLAAGLDRIRARFQVPEGFPPEVTAAARDAARRKPGDHVDRTGLPFVTLDPASSTDLDQAFFIERSGRDLLLRYAIADVGWFVRDGDAVDREAWRRGTTTYLPDGKAGLHPPELAEGAASLLPDGPRPAIVLTTRLGPGGEIGLDGVERAVVRSRSKLAYGTVRDDQLPEGFAEFAARVDAAGDRRGASRIDPPQQEVEQDEGGHLQLRFRPRRAAEDRNAALSLATNIAVAAVLFEAQTGLFRVMPPPDARAEHGLRRTAAAFGLEWPEAMSLVQFERTLDGAIPREAAFMTAVRRASTGAEYIPWTPGPRPWHAALAATYAHATAPLRRLADRYVLETVLALAQGRPVPETASTAFARLPQVMARAAARDAQIERAVIDLAETVLLSGQQGESFAAVVTDTAENGARIQLCDLPVVARVPGSGMQPGERVTVRLDAIDVDRDGLRFVRAD